MDARLKILFGPMSGQSIPVLAGKLIIGREEDCHLRPPSEFISRHHCVLLLDEYTLRIRDLGSKNGTYVNGRRIGKGESILSPDDFVSVGDFVVQVDFSPVTAAAPPEVPNGQPAASPPSLNGTGVFDGDTLQTESPGVVSTSSAPAAPMPPAPMQVVP
jgi:pSer/pThr/pTyr-binding forkhead associated (FHA) protein